jgi:hypothetical protein
MTSDIKKIIEPSPDHVVVECSTLSPQQRTELQTFLKEQPEVLEVTRKLHVTDALLNPGTLGLVPAGFDLVALLHPTTPPEMATEIGTALAKKVTAWGRAHGPRS